MLTQTKLPDSVCPTAMERVAKTRLAQTGYPRLKEVECSYQDGTMTLRGRVSSYYLKQLAQEALRNVTHVRRLINHLEVLSPC